MLLPDSRHYSRINMIHHIRGSTTTITQGPLSRSGYASDTIFYLPSSSHRAVYYHGKCLRQVKCYRPTQTSPKAGGYLLEAVYYTTSNHITPTACLRPHLTDLLEAPECDTPHNRMRCGFSRFRDQSGNDVLIFQRSNEGVASFANPGRTKITSIMIFSSLR